MKLTRTFLLLPLFSLYFASPLASGVAQAEPTPEDRTLARSLFEEGRVLMRDGKFSDACPKLVESERLEPGIGTLFNLGDCFEHTGKVASAWSAFSEAADLAKRAGQSDREQVARDRASTLAPRLSRVQIHLATPPPPGLSITLDGKTLSAAVLDTDIAVDAGDHRVGALAPGKKPNEQVVQLQESAHQIVTVPALEDAPVEVTPPPPPPPKDIAPPPPPPHDDSMPWQKKTAFVAGGAAVVSLGLGSYFGLHANGLWSDAQKSCVNGVCDSAGYSSWNDAKSNAGASTGFFVAGIVLAAAAVVLFVIAPSNHESAPASQPSAPAPAAAAYGFGTPGFPFGGSF